MKKFQFSMFAIMIMALVCVGFASCDSDDDDNTLGRTDKIDPVKEEMKPFLGKWQIEANDYYHEVTYPDYSIFFYQDGKCLVSQINNDTKNQYYSWDYDATNKYLSIAGLANAQWQITSIGEDAWTGLALWTGGSNGYSAKKDTVTVNTLKFLVYAVGTWKCDTVTYTGSEVSRIYSYVGEKAPYKYRFNNVWYGNKNLNEYTEIKADKEKDVIVLDHRELWNSNELTIVR